jgi:predicted nucleotidyltransferase
MQLITKVVVGSRLHGLNNETSDYDYRGIFMHPMKDVLSPFKTLKSTQWIEGQVDDTAYELREFCKFATKGNPTILEVFWSNMIIDDSSIMEDLRANRLKFLDSTAIYNAFRGYAHNQYTKMNLFDVDARTPKFAVAYIRTLQQGIELLDTGDFTPQVVEDRDFLLDVKYNFNPSHIEPLSKKFVELQTLFSEAYVKNESKFKCDIEWIEDFIFQSYKTTL